MCILRLFSNRNCMKTYLLLSWKFIGIVHNNALIWHRTGRKRCWLWWIGSWWRWWGWTIRCWAATTSRWCTWSWKICKKIQSIYYRCQCRVYYCGIFPTTLRFLKCWQWKKKKSITIRTIDCTKKIFTGCVIGMKFFWIKLIFTDLCASTAYSTNYS